MSRTEVERRLSAASSVSARILADSLGCDVGTIEAILGELEKSGVAARENGRWVRAGAQVRARSGQPR